MQPERGRRLFCSERCANTVKARRKRAKKRERREEERKALNIVRLDRAASADGRGSMRRGPKYEAFVEAGGPAMVDDGLTHDDIAAIFDVSRVTVTHWLAAAREDAIRDRDRAGWDGPPAEAQETLDDFVAFRNRYFKLPDGSRYETTGFHLRWVQAILDAITYGRRIVILSPPRHGKTELLVHVCVWLIVRNPNIRIMWVGGNTDIAKGAVGLVMAELENNETLIADFCGPGGSFKPTERRGTKWTQEQFVVATRTVAQKSPTMIAIGRGGKLLSRDADLIVSDDIEDHDTTAQPASRDDTKRWWSTNLASRKEEHTGWVAIGSRQHPDDLYSVLLQDGEWDAIVEQAHDEAICKATSDSDHHDCMLWPTKRTYKWLTSQIRSISLTVGADVAEMQYLNVTNLSGARAFTKERIDPCKNTGRVAGDLTYRIAPDRTLRSCRLVGGLDPAASGYQAAFLWAVDVDTMTRFMVDLDNTKGGGLEGALDIVRQWYIEYHLTHWVFESNNVQEVYRQSKELRDFCATNGIKVEPHHTGAEKHDPRFGVTSIAQHMKADSELPGAVKLVDLPYGDAESVGKVDQWARQAIAYSGMTGRKQRVKQDILMASWFPLPKVVAGWQRERVAEIHREYRGTGYPVGSRLSTVPWRKAS